ncbi:hypothetical protein FSARC_7409 [Fusarium sarcochroum]|uniref:Uncharacterized protein n=1 Tax=Fusarium sarcochroum TaxID=1208366 RepID=A0A8H4TVD4_9HYPO|nr:hypothetical protein FSARC_7409 [Fusarium sarcochroum]
MEADDHVASPATGSKEKRKAFIAAVGRALKNNRASHIDSSEDMEPRVKVGGVSEADTTQQDAAENQTFEYKLPYYSRRAQSKSEPSQGSHGSEDTDMNGTALTAVTEEPRSPVHRRVTLPPMKTAGSQIPIPSEHTQTLSSAAQAANDQCGDSLQGPNKQHQHQETEPALRSSSATYPPYHGSGLGNESATRTDINDGTNIPLKSNEPSELGKENVTSGQRRGGRGGRRGRTPWYRGRRGRGNYRGASQSGQVA